jgi:hypothetical protein
MEIKSDRVRRTIYRSGSILGIVWILTAWHGITMVSSKIADSHGGRDIPLERVSRSEFKVDRGFCNDTIVITSPLPFIVKARFVDTRDPTYDLAYVYFFWYGDAVIISERQAYDGLRRK